MTTYLTQNPESNLELVPGKLYAADFEIFAPEDLAAMQGMSDFMKVQKQQMEAELKKRMSELGHVVEFVEFTLKTPARPPETSGLALPFNITGSLDLDASSVTAAPAYPPAIARVYFRIHSITAVVLVSVLIAVFTASVLLTGPTFIGILEASGDIVGTMGDVTKAVIQEPRKFVELGANNFLPIIALLAAVSFFLLRK